MGVSHTSSSQLSRAFEKLVSTIRNLKGLPLTILGVHAAAPAFADTEPFPPSAVASGAPPPPGAAPLDFFITFESSGKWPDNLEAVAQLQTAFYLRLASLVEDQAKEMVCEVRPDALYVQCEGFTYRGMIHHEPEQRLVAAAHGAVAAQRLRWRTTAGAQHTSSISALTRTHPSLGPAIRLARRWLACQLYSGDAFPPALVELLVALPYASAAVERPPGSALCGFAAFLHTLATFDFRNEPLLLGLDQPVTAAMREAADSAFAATRRRPLRSPCRQRLARPFGWARTQRWAARRLARLAPRGSRLVGCV